MPSSESSNLSQFNLRTMFAIVALLAVVFAATRYGGFAGLLAAATLAALVAGHIVGNVIGTRLRDEVSPQFNPKPAPMPRRMPRVHVVATERRLHQHTPMGRIILVTCAGAALVGAVLGGLALHFWTEASMSGWVVGTLSSALLGGFFGFLLAAFLEMTIRAWWQAVGREEGAPGRLGDGGEGETRAE